MELQRVGDDWETELYWTEHFLEEGKWGGTVTTALEIQPPHVPASNNELVLVGLTQSWVGPGVRFSLGIATTNLDSVLKSRDITLVTKVCIVSYGFSSSHIQMWELDHKEGWVLKNWDFQIVVLQKALDSPLNSKEIKPVNPKGNQLWIFIGKTDSEAKTPILWPPGAKSWLTGKDSGAGQDRRQKDKRATEDEMVR